MAETDRSGILGPMLVMFVTSAANLVALGPATTRVMKERKHQGMYYMTYLLHANAACWPS